MKLKLAIIAVSVGVLSACTQKTCPTYAQEDTQEVKKEREIST